MLLDSVSFNASMVAFLCKVKELKTLYVFSSIICCTAELGYISIDDYHKFVIDRCNISKRTAKRWVTLLIDKNLVECKSGILHPISKKELLIKYMRSSKAEYHSVKYVLFPLEALKNYKNFRNHFIRQYALIVQKRFFYFIKSMPRGETAHSFVKRGKIKTQLEFVRNSKKAGCSLSQLHKHLNFNKGTISKALKGYTEKQYNYSYDIKGAIFRKKYKGFIMDLHDAYGLGRKSSNKLAYVHNKKNDTYKMRCQVASKILVVPTLKKIKYRRVKRKDVV